MLARWFITEERRYGMHNPPVNFLKRGIRRLVFRLNPRMGDCFFVVARRKPSASGMDNEPALSR